MGSDLSSQGQNQVWNTDSLAPDPGSLLPCGLHQEVGEPGKYLLQGSLSCPWKFIICQLNVDQKHWFLRRPYRMSCWDFSSFSSVLCWQIKIQWAPFVGSLIKYSHLNCKQFLHLPLGWEDQNSNALTRWEKDIRQRKVQETVRVCVWTLCLPGLFSGGAN